jgi:ATP-dependent Clp protease adaptor protein ClpS
MKLREDMMIRSDFQTQYESEVLEDTILDQERELIVLNDDYNTFDHVIETLVKVCKHSRVQAEQCTYIIHYRGKCTVKSGSFKELKPMHEGILEAGIGAIIK